DIAIAREDEAGMGRVYVLFGSGQDTSSGAIDLMTELDGTRGFRVDGDPELGESRTGRSVAAVGDVNGDGVDDFAIGTQAAAGVAYIVFGRMGGGFPAAFDLGQLNEPEHPAGVRIIDTGGDFLFAGEVVAGAGDLNGDGIDDLALGAPSASG